MDVTHMHEVLVLAEHLNYTTAAAQLFVSQPTLTRHVNAVEEELGTRLFKRTNHMVELTQAGKVAVKAFENVVETYDTLLPELARTGGVFVGSMLLTAIPQQHHEFVAIEADDFVIDVALVCLRDNENKNIARLAACIPDIRKPLM